MSFTDTFFNNYGGDTNNTSGVNFINKVYLGTETKTVQGRGEKLKTTKDKTETIAQAKARYLSDPKLQASWAKLLRKNGFETDELNARAMWEISVSGASDWYSTSNGQQKVTPEQYLTWYSRKTQKPKTPTLPTRQIYQVAEEQIQTDIDEISQKRRGSTITEDDKKQDWYKNLVKSINDMYAQGTVTTVKEVINPKTGKKEKQVIQTPGFSKEKISQQIEQVVKTASPVDVERKDRVDFTKWLLSQRGGRE